VQLDKQELVKILRAEGDNDRADRVAEQLPDAIDTDTHADALAAVGLDRSTLQAKLAGGAIGGNLQI
jgi:chemotaxis receptor (MCP) glutamine deamidase CheD